MSNKHEFKTIVVPYDGSDQAKHAFSMACDLIGDDPDAKLMLLHVVPSGMVGTMDNAEGNTIDGVPWGLLDYETYKDVVSAALDRVKKEVLDSLGDSIHDERITVEAVADTSPRATCGFFSSHFVPTPYQILKPIPTFALLEA